MRADLGAPVRMALFLLLVAGGVVLLYKGVLPSLGNTKGDFANYYTAARLLVEGRSLERAYYDFAWFQQQMDRYGIRNQVGGWTPHPPPTALLFLPLTPFEPLRAKQVWILINLLLVPVNIFLLTRVSRLHWLPTSVLFLGSGYALLNNFLFGQLYLLLLASILSSYYWLDRGKPAVAGLCLATLAPVKYVGLFFLGMFAWKRQWRLLLAATAVMAVLIIALLWVDYQSFQTFLQVVLPRHLKGEIQDPYSVNFQSWSSLLRRLFLYEETLNPNPLLVSPFLYFLLNHWITWLLSAVAIVLMVRLRFPCREHQVLFQMGWLPAALLLISPGGATYHFLLLTISVVFFVRILLDLGRTSQAWALSVLFVLINVPHYMSLKEWAVGGLTPLAYTRLWFLLAFCVASIYFFRPFLSWKTRSLLLLMAVLTPSAALVSIYDYISLRAQPQDQASRVRLSTPEFQRHLGLIVQAPDLGRRQTVFSYCQLVDNNYAVYSTEGRPWIVGAGGNYYNPDLAPDDTSLLVETVVEGRNEILLSQRVGGGPVFLVAGKTPSWQPSGRAFAFERGGRLFFFDLLTKVEIPLPGAAGSYDPSFSPSGESLVYCVKEQGKTSLRRLDLAQQAETVIFRSSGYLESPQWSADQRKIVFSARVGNNHDIWAVNLVDNSILQLTSNPAMDRDPVWDQAQDRILFTSDRARGLGCTTLFWIPIPEELR